jgi:hypothetical protein
VYYASDYVDIKCMIHLLKELNVKIATWFYYSKGKKAKNKDAIKARKKGSCKKDSLLNRKGAYSRGDYEASNTQNQIRFLLVY